MKELGMFSGKWLSWWTVKITFHEKEREKKLRLIVNEKNSRLSKSEV